MDSLKAFFQKASSYSSKDGAQDQAKKAAADEALALVESGMSLGLGTGSTVDFFLQGLAARVKRGLEVVGIPTSSVTEARAKELGIPLVLAEGYPDLRSDLCVDGADRVDLHRCLIKGGGGALLREKLVATHSSRVCILVDPSKLVDVFDNSFAVPVECVLFGVQSTIGELTKLGCQATLRETRSGQSLVTDNGNCIVDCRFASIAEPQKLEVAMLTIPGVVEAGIFSDLLDDLVVGFADGTAQRWSL